MRRDERNKGRTAVLTSNNLIVNLSERAVFYGDTVVPFSKREFDIIEFLMTNANQVFDKERIYEAVWGYDAEGDSNVIKGDIRKIRGKLNEITGQDYIETIWGVGYKMERYKKIKQFISAQIFCGKCSCNSCNNSPALIIYNLGLHVISKISAAGFKQCFS